MKVENGPRKIAQKVADLSHEKFKKDNYLSQADLRIERATHALEDTITAALSQRAVSETQAAKILGCSRDKIRGMVKRSNERNMKLMRGVA